MVSILSRRVGVMHRELVEDAVQNALASALETWKTTAPPDRPSAWIYRVAHNEILGELRRSSRRDRLLQQSPESEFTQGAAETSAHTRLP